MSLPHRYLVLIIAVIAAGPATGQRTWVVDQQRRPGIDFAQIQPAVAKAGAGDTIIVRPQRPGSWYHPFNVNKGLRILVQQLVTVEAWFQKPVLVTGLPTSETLVLKGFSTVSRVCCIEPIVVRDCKGSVHIEDIRISPAPTSPLQSSGPALPVSGGGVLQR